jgi:hypothetical protein
LSYAGVTLEDADTARVLDGGVVDLAQLEPRDAEMRERVALGEAVDRVRP